MSVTVISIGQEEIEKMRKRDMDQFRSLMEQGVVDTIPNLVREVAGQSVVQLWRNFSPNDRSHIGNLVWYFGLEGEPVDDPRDLDRPADFCVMIGLEKGADILVDAWHQGRAPIDFACDLRYSLGENGEISPLKAIHGHEIERGVFLTVQFSEDGVSSMWVELSGEGDWDRDYKPYVEYLVEDQLVAFDLGEDFIPLTGDDMEEEDRDQNLESEDDDWWDHQSWGDWDD